jgi:prepilin-type N-terminal cleavage/methylation domain-containing protein
MIYIGKTRRPGFTLIEALVGSLIFAVGAVVICGLSHRCVVNNVRGQEYEQAYRLLDECLEKASTELDDLIRKEKVESDFQGRYPEYKYSLVIEPSDTANVYSVTAEVFWYVADEKYSIKAQTLLYHL